MPVGRYGRKETINGRGNNNRSETRDEGQRRRPKANESQSCRPREAKSTGSQAADEEITRTKTVGREKRMPKLQAERYKGHKRSENKGSCSAKLPPLNCNPKTCLSPLSQGVECPTSQITTSELESPIDTITASTPDHMIKKHNFEPRRSRRRKENSLPRLKRNKNNDGCEKNNNVERNGGSKSDQSSEKQRRTAER